MTQKQFNIKSMKKIASGGDRKAVEFLLKEQARLYPEPPDSHHAADFVAPNDADALTIAEFKEELRQQLLRELAQEDGSRDDADEGENER